MAEEISSPRFIWGKQLVKELCMRERDFILANRMYYMLFVKDAFLMLNMKTQMLTERVALPVNRGTNYILTPANMLEWCSISAPNHDGKLDPMIINTNINIDVADLSTAKRCGCSCGCTHDHCASVRNFETIYGTMTATMPDGSTSSFTTTYRKIILKDGSYVEEKTLPVLSYDNNVHVATTLQKQTTVICNLDLLECGCIKQTSENRQLIESNCQAVNVAVECGCAVPDSFQPKHHCDDRSGYNVDETGDRIYISSDFNHDYIVLRYFANAKTKDIRIPYLAKEPMMSAIKVLSSTFSKRTKNEVEFWKGDFKQKYDDMVENMTPIKLTTLYHNVLGSNSNHHHPDRAVNGFRIV